MIVFDLDGTLSDHTHRLKFIAGKEVRTPEDWDNYHSCGIDDPPILTTMELFRRLAWDQHLRIEIWTCRPEKYRQMTIRWMNIVGLNGVAQLRMRQNTDPRSSVDIKQSWLLNSPIKPHFAFDDRSDICEMYRRNGVTCYQVDDIKF